MKISKKLNQKNLTRILIADIVLAGVITTGPEKCDAFDLIFPLS
jgi:hypothetical protein